MRLTCGRRERYIGLMEKPAGKSQFGKPKHRQKDNVMIYLLTAFGLSPGGSSTVHIYTQTICRTIQNK
jgi:hypothetical protein